MFTKITERLYISTYQNYKFTLELGYIGTLSCGKCWRLRLIAPFSLFLGAFTIKDDGDEIYKKTVGNKLWNSIDEIIPNAEEIVQRTINGFSN